MPAPEVLAPVAPPLEAPPQPQFSIPTPLLIVLLGVCGFASTFTMRLVDPLVPTLAAEFGQSVHQIAFLVTAFAGCYALGQPFLGPIADSVGKLRSISTCLALLCVLSGLAAFFSPTSFSYASVSFVFFVFAFAMTGRSFGSSELANTPYSE